MSECYLNAMDETARTLTDSSWETEILRKDTIAGNGAFSFISVYSCNFSLFQFTVFFFHAKVRNGGKAGLGNSRESMRIKTLTGK